MTDGIESVVLFEEEDVADDNDAARSGAEDTFCIEVRDEDGVEEAATAAACFCSKAALAIPTVDRLSPTAITCCACGFVANNVAAAPFEEPTGAGAPPALW